MNYTQLRQREAKWAAWKRLANCKRKEMENKLAKYDGIKVTQEDLVLLDIAIGSHLKKRNGYVDRGELLADGYEGLLNAIRLYKSDKCNNRNGYIVAKIKFWLVDCFRDETRIRNKYQHNPTSIDVIMGSGEDSIGSLIADKEVKQPDQLLMEKEVVELVKEEFSKAILRRKYNYTSDDLFTILMLRLENNSYQDVADLLDVSQGTIYNIYSKQIQPVLDKVKERLSEPIAL
jgi:DNA-directed RNA polymerase specialized sigma subunit